MNKNFSFYSALRSVFRNISKKLIFFLDCIIFSLVVYYITYNLFIKLSFWFDPSQYFTTDVLCNAVGENKVPNVNSTTTTIIHNDSGWGSSIRQLFIYGTGAFRLHLIRGGTPMTRTFIIGSTIVADAASKAFTNAINDPEYVEKHIASWKRILGKNNSSVEIDLGEDLETFNKLKAITTATKYSSNGSEDWSEKLLNSVISVLKPILEPVSVDYSNELLANRYME